MSDWNTFKASFAQQCIEAKKAMSEVKHTDGFWILDRRDPDRLYIAQQYGDGTGGRICEVFENCLVRGLQREANANVISAAPELLDALTGVFEMTIPKELKDIFGAAWYDKARAAIEKATGSQA